MTQAVYHEAAGEGADGERAVAQIILNRMRHPAYPATVCGVVYQGAERTTVASLPSPATDRSPGCPCRRCGNKRARSPSRPWAARCSHRSDTQRTTMPTSSSPIGRTPSTNRCRLGATDLYRLKAGLGASGAFRQRYGGVEPLPILPTTVEVALDAVQNSGPLLTESAPPDPLQVSSGQLINNGEPKPQLAADNLQGTLIIDGDTATRSAPAKRKSKGNAACPEPTDKQLKALPSNDLRSGGTTPDC